MGGRVHVLLMMGVTHMGGSNRLLQQVMTHVGQMCLVVHVNVGRGGTVTKKSFAILGVLKKINFSTLILIASWTHSKTTLHSENIGVIIPVS